MGPKSLVVISDMHCGAYSGLTPPGYFIPYHAISQKEAWAEYMRIVNKWQAPDVLLVNGDCIEGRQSKQGGAELITSDRNVQVDMAIECIEVWKAKRVLMTYGSKYHVGDQAEDFEYNVAKAVKADIEGHLIFTLAGLTIDARHKLASSTVPYSRTTALEKEVVWGLVEDATGTGTKAKLTIRSHVHYHKLIEDPDYTAFTTPGLQLKKGRYGSRECSGKIHWGAIKLLIQDGQIVGKEKDICILNANKPRIIRIR